MSRPSKEYKQKIKEELLEALRKENAFWSYQPSSISLQNMGDELLIAYTLRFLDQVASKG